MASSIGLSVSSTGSISDVVLESPADKALLCPDTTILAVNGGKFSIPALVRAVRESPKSRQIKLTVSFKESVRDVTIEYSDGLKYPHIVRDEGHPDRLPDLLAPLVK